MARLRQLIEDGHFPPGSRLPPERVLAAQLGVGRPALREALKALSGLGVVESRHRAGNFVRPLAPVETRSPGFTVLELLEARKILEPRSAWLAATRASETQLLEIEAARQNLEAHDDDARLVARLDYELHAAIVRAARNPALELMSRVLMSRVLGSGGLASRFMPDVARMRRDHRNIVEAILKRHADGAEKAMTDHLHSVGLDFISEAAR